MANVVTWRNVNSANQSDAFNFTRLGTQQINRGLSGFQNQITGIAEAQEQEAFDNALAQINDLGSVDAVRQAQDGSFINTISGGDTNLANRLQGALDTRGNDLRQQFVTRNAYDDTVRTQQERGIIANYQNALTNRDDKAAEGFLNQLSNETQARLRPELVGFRDNQLIGNFNKALANGDLKGAERYYNTMSPELQGEYGGSFNDARTKAANKDFLTQAYNNVQQRMQLSATAERVASDYPIYAQDIEVRDGKLRAKEGGALTQELLDQIVARDYSDGVTSAPTYDSLTTGILSNPATDLISPSTIMQASEFVTANRNLDPVYQRQQREAANALATQKQVSELQTNALLANNPVDAALTPQEGLTLDSVFKEFERYTQSNDGWFDFGKGDYDAFRSTAEKVINKGYKPKGASESQEYNPVVIREALNATQAVREAVNEGNLGDTWDNINEDEFESLLELYQAKYNENELRRATNLQTQVQNVRNQNALR